MVSYKIFIEQDKSSIYNLRQKVLRQPLGLNLFEEDLTAEANQIIIIAELSKSIIGCIMLVPIDNKVLKLRQMAVDFEWQNKHIGDGLLIAAEAYALEQDFLKIELHARKTALNFYLKNGFQQVGDVFDEVGIAHVKCIKSMAHF
jgi:predicted GNAT family N-acyltransferase